MAWSLMDNYEEMSRLVTKPTKWHVRPGKTQISLVIRPVWSESSLSEWRKFGSSATHWAHSEDSDQTGRTSRLIWIFAGRSHFVGFVMRRLKYNINANIMRVKLCMACLECSRVQWQHRRLVQNYSGIPRENHLWGVAWPWMYCQHWREGGLFFADDIVVTAEEEEDTFVPEDRPDTTTTRLALKHDERDDR